MPIDLDALSLKELKALEKELPKAIERNAERQKMEARLELDARAKELGYSLSELMDVSPKKARKTATAKFAHPDDRSITWTGRGRKPKWYADAVANGKTPEDLAV
jgi:DNA-binding protein H-NS